jgi:hypothetical protein
MCVKCHHNLPQNIAAFLAGLRPSLHLPLQEVGEAVDLHFFVRQQTLVTAQVWHRLYAWVGTSQRQQ